MYSIQSRVRYSEVDRSRDMTFLALMNYFQDCCAIQSEDIGRGVDYLMEHEIAWVLSSWQIVMVRPPRFGEQITVNTWPYDFKGLYGYRNFSLENEQGEILAYANSVWVFVDTKLNRPAKIPKTVSEAYHLEEKYPMEYADRKIALPKEMEAKKSFAVQPEQIDTNHHVNNERYVAMAQNFLGENVRILKMRAEYKKAAVLGDTIFPFVHKDGKIVTVSLADEQAVPYAIVEFVLE